MYIYSIHVQGTGCVDLRTGNCYTEYNTTRNGLSVCGGDITKGGYNANSRNRGIDSLKNHLIHIYSM